MCRFRTEAPVRFSPVFLIALIVNCYCYDVITDNLGDTRIPTTLLVVAALSRAQTSHAAR